MKELIKKVTEVSSPSGRESAIREMIINEIKDSVDEIKTDNIGNLIAVKKGTSGKTVLFDAHMDEIGFVVSNITDEGFLRIDKVGGINLYTLFGAKLQFNGHVGVVGAEGELFAEYGSKQKNPNFDEIYVDIGARTREEAEKLAPIGTFGTYVEKFADLGDKLVSKAMDDRIGCAVIIDSIKNMKENKHTAIYVFAVQEEIGLIGASVAGYNYNIDMAVAIDVMGVNDTPRANKRACRKLGGGALIKVKDGYSICDEKVVNFLVKTAEKHNIPYQMEVAAGGGTDAGGYTVTKDGIASGGISIPTRYIHSPNEMVHMSDLENISKFINVILNEEI